jgi:predicted transcriptional regulator
MLAPKNGSVVHSLDEVAQALRAAEGIISNAAQRLGVTRQAVQQRISRHPTLQAIRDESREGVTDLAESQLIEAIRRGEAWSICFYLKTQGRDRGYVERTEEHRAVTGDIRIRIEAVDDRGDPR